MRGIGKGWLLSLFVATYLCLDFADPFMPGAYEFDPDQSVDGVSPSSDDARQESLPVAATPPRSGRMAEVPLANPRHTAIFFPIEWAIVLRQAHPPSSDPPSLSEDH